MLNQRIVLKSRPTGVPVAENFELTSEPVRDLSDGEVLIENLLFAIDPATRGRLDDRASYAPPVAIGGLIPTMVLGRVIRSRNPDFREGDFGRGYVGWEQYSILNPGNIVMENLKVDPAIPLSAYMGALGWSGLTAYIGLHKIGEMRSAETVVVSAAAGAVGSVAGQIAKLRGNRVVGIVGGAEKVRVIGDLGMDAAIDHRQAVDLQASIAQACPDGADIYFDNVGGRVLDCMLPRMADRGRIIVCGMVADYNQASDPYPVRNQWQILVHRLTVRGFLAYEYPEMLDEAKQAIAGWIRSGELRALENVSTGLTSAPAAFIRLMSGVTVGKTIVRLNDRVTTMDSRA